MRLKLGKRLKLVIFILPILCFVGCLDESSKNNVKKSENEIISQNIKSDIDLSKVKVGYCTPSLNAPYYSALLTSIQETTENAGMTFSAVNLIELKTNVAEFKFGRNTKN